MQLARVGEEFGVSCYSGGGFDGLVGKHDAAERAIGGGKETCILHIGDYDASGEWILTALAEDVTAFAAAGGAELEFVRVAVTPEQVETYHEAIESRRDLDALRQAIEREPAERQALIDRLTLHAD